MGKQDYVIFELAMSFDRISSIVPAPRLVIVQYITINHKLQTEWAPIHAAE